MTRPTLLFACMALTAIACAPDETTQPSNETAPGLSTASAVTYRVRDLGTLGGPNSNAHDINNSGIVVGESRTPSGSIHAFRWTSGTMTDLGTLGGPNSSAGAINNSGVIVGYAQNSAGRDKAVRWTGGGKRNLGTLGGRNSRANDINTNGWIVGWSETANGEMHAFLWRDGAMTDLGTLGGPTSVANAISSSGAVVGYSTKTASPIATLFPFVWKNGVMRELSTLGGAYAIPNAINDQIVGTAEPEGGDGDISHAVVWENNAARTLTDLGRLNGGDFNRAFDINEDGIIVGHIDYNPPDCVDEDAFVWHQGTLTLLPEIGGENRVAGAHAINRTGRIVGFSETNTNSGDCELGNVHAALWIPN